MYILNLQALVTDLKKHKLSASDQRKYFCSLILSYGLFLLLPVIYLLRIEQDLLALSLTGLQVAILLLVSGFSYRKVTRKSNSAGFLRAQFSAVAFVQLMRILFLIILEVVMLALAALIIGAIVFLVYKLGELPSLAGYNLLNHRLLAGLLLVLIIALGYLLFKFIATALINSKLAKLLGKKLSQVFDEREFSLNKLPKLLFYYLPISMRPLRGCFHCGDTNKQHKCLNYNGTMPLTLLVVGINYFTFLTYYNPYDNNFYAAVALCIILGLFQLFWLRQVNLALGEVQQ